MRYLSIFLIGLIGIFNSPSGLQAQEPSVQTSLRERINGFNQQIEQVMDHWSVPGLAVAIVSDTSVVWSRGFGYRDVENQKPVTDSTLFPIGSTTKAFTAAALGILHDDGRLEWKKPVQEYLPNFDMQDEFAAEEMTPVDLLTHRSGLPRHDLLWYITDYSRRELLSRLEYLEPSASFRSKFQYNNLMYMVAGYLAGRIGGSGWETLIQKRIFDPLEMAKSDVSVDTMVTTDDYARPYHGGNNNYKPVEYHNMDGIAPAGAINSNASEMARWIQLFLNDGTTRDGTSIIDSTTVAQLMRPRIVTEDLPPYARAHGSTLLYALGWIAESYEGHRLLWHEGGIDGFRAITGFMPDDEVGWVILTNKHGTPATPLLMYELVDRVIDKEGKNWNQLFSEMFNNPLSADEPDPESESKSSQSQSTKKSNTTAPSPAPSHPLEDYVAQYSNQGYGIFKVTMDGDSLVGHYGTVSSSLRHDQYDVFELHPEIAGSTQTIKVQFKMAMNGNIEKVAIPLESEVSPIVFERTVGKRLMSADYLKQFSGEYDFRGRIFTVELSKNQTLTLTIPGQPTYELVPSAENTFQLNGNANLTLKFKKEDQAVSQMIFYEPDGTYVTHKK